MTQKICIVCGPTACGKSARAIEIARTRDGVIINADAMQVYRELRILTARPTQEDERQAPHLLYGVLSASDACSVARWLEMAREAIDKTLAEGKLPVVTGGTGLYIKALMNGLADIPAIPPEIRTQAQDLWVAQGAKALEARDPLMSRQLKSGDKQRHIRALEVFFATGKSLAYWQSAASSKPYPDAMFETELMQVPREELYRYCDARLLTMMQAGALGEVKALLALGLSDELPAMRAVGVPELTRHLKGLCSLEEAVEKAQQATRNYAKRQVTWFKHQL